MNKLYRKTALIEATQWFQVGDHPAVIMKDGVPWVETLEGGHEVTPSDWIATGVKGEHWPIKADVFAASYEEADTTAQAEIERLTKALEATRDHCPQCEGEGQYLCGPRHNQNMVPCEFCENARAALSGSQP